MKIKPLSWVWMALLLAACSVTQPVALISTPILSPTVNQVIPATIAPTLTLTPTAVPGTATPAAPTVTPQSISPTAVLRHQLSMEAGQTETAATGHLEADQQQTYSFNAQAGQFLELALNSTNSSLVLELTTPNHQALVKASDQAQSWKGTLPASGQYQVMVDSKDTGGDYTLTVTIPVRVEFAPGTTSITMNGFAASQQITTNMVKAE